MQDNVNFEESFVGKAALHRIAKRMGRNASAGLVLHSYLHLCEIGVEPSLEKASKLASEVGYSINGVWLRVSDKERFTKLNADQTGMKQAFREYRGVAHIIAARMLFSERTSGLNPYQWSQTDILNFARLAFEIQQKVERIPDSARWDLFRLIDHPKEFDKVNGLSNNLAARMLKLELNKAYKVVFA